MGINSLSGVLLEGNSGCGKTLIAQSIAQTCRATFIGVSVTASYPYTNIENKACFH
jgi:ATP-dependent 26S proteasome regulatory subunit